MCVYNALHSPSWLHSFLLPPCRHRSPPRDPQADPIKERKESSEPAKYWAEQTVEGTLTMANAPHRLVGVQMLNGTSFQFRVGPRTQIVYEDQRMSLVDLSGHIGRAVTVKFLPARSGNLAQKMVASK